MIIPPDKDPIGHAVFNYHRYQDNTPMIVHSEVIENEELPPDYFFRKHSEMPRLERIALKHARGQVLDVGAGAGCHALYLQEKNHQVTVLEPSTLCCEVMLDRGIKRVKNTDILSFNMGKYDTILLLMNGVGIAGSISGLKKMLLHLKTLMHSSSKILLDSSDLIYLYEQEDGSHWVNLNADHYYGEISYQLNYKEFDGEPFSWLFADPVLLSDVAEEAGLSMKILEYGPHYDYLAELKLM